MAIQARWRCPPERLDELGQLEGARDDRLVLARPLLEQPVVRVATAFDELDHGDALGDERLLRQEPQAPGDLLGRQLTDDHAVEEHPAVRRREQA